MPTSCSTASARSAPSRPPPGAPRAGGRPAPAPVAQHRATYLGNDRLLVSTNWGGKLLMSASDLSLTPEVVHDGNYEQAFSDWLTRTLRGGNVVFDIGANVGLFTLQMAKLVGRNGRVVAYEAAPENVSLLADIMAMNYLTGSVKLHAKAASAKAGTLTFYASTRFRGNGSTIPHDEAYMEHFAVDGERRIEVDAEPLDAHFDRFDNIDLVKIDVEGGEEQVFAGMERLMAGGKVSRVVFDCSATGWPPTGTRTPSACAASPPPAGRSPASSGTGRSCSATSSRSSSSATGTTC